MKIDFQATFQKLLEYHVKMGYLRDKRIQRILEDFPLERLFTTDQLARFVLQDAPVLFYYRDEENVRTVSAPHMISMMTSMLELDPNDRVLILGSKGGLIEATIAKAVKNVFILEEHEEVASITEESFIKLGLTNIWVRQSNPLYGLQNEAPFNKILITGAVPFIPHGILTQLSSDGIIVAPIMIKHPNQQLIFQIIKHDQYEDFEIINFGGVIFQPLYFNEIPPMDQFKDINLEKIILTAKNQVRPEMLEQKEFFEDFRYLPVLDFQQIVFGDSDSIIKRISFASINENFQQIVKKQKNDESQEVKSQKETIKILFYNPLEKPFEFIMQITFPYVEEKQIIPIQAKPGNNQIELPLLIPLQQGNYILDLLAIGPKKYRISHVKAIIYVNKGKDEWDFSIEYTGLDEEKKDEDEEIEY